MQALLVLCTCPSHDLATTLARSLVETRLAACVNLLPQVQSVYRWQGTVESAQEVLLLIKTTRARLQDVQDHIVSRHPGELPEIVAVEIASGLDRYLHWIAAETVPALS